MNAAQKKAAEAAKVAAAEAERLAAGGTDGGEGDGDEGDDEGQDTQGDTNGPAAGIIEGSVAAAAAAVLTPPVPAAATAPAAPEAAGPKTAGRVAASLLAQFVLEGAGRQDNAAVALMIEACERFNVDPRRNRTPMELLAWRFLPGNDLAIPPVPDAVVIVTAGGVKLKHYEDPAFPMDPETDERLAKVFNAFAIDPKTKDVTRKPLPDSLALPASAVTGEVLTQNHIHPGGYLRREGASTVDAAKAARQKARLQKLGL